MKIIIEISNAERKWLLRLISNYCLRRKSTISTNERNMANNVKGELGVDMMVPED